MKIARMDESVPLTLMKNELRNDTNVMINSTSSSYRCSACHVCFNDVSRLKGHYSAAHLHYYPYECIACHEWFPSRTQLREHVEDFRHFPLRFLCDYDRVKNHELALAISRIVKGTAEVSSSQVALSRQESIVSNDTSSVLLNESAAPIGDNFAAASTSASVQRLFAGEPMAPNDDDDVIQIPDDAAEDGLTFNGRSVTSNETSQAIGEPGKLFGAGDVLFGERSGEGFCATLDDSVTVFPDHSETPGECGEASDERSAVLSKRSGSFDGESSEVSTGLRGTAFDRPGGMDGEFSEASREYSVVMRKRSTSFDEQNDTAVLTTPSATATPTDSSANRRTPLSGSLLPCPHCSKMCKGPKELKRHSGTHSNAFPFGCTFCDKHFKRKDNVLRHQAAKHSVGKVIHKCSICDVLEYSRARLKQHVTTHHPDY